MLELMCCYNETDMLVFSVQSQYKIINQFDYFPLKKKYKKVKYSNNKYFINKANKINT